MQNLRFTLTILLLTVLVAFSKYSEAAAPIAIRPTGPASYSITASDLPDAAGIELTVLYDSTALGEPKVKSGTLTSSAMMQENVATAGVVRIVFITGGVIKGSGEVASVTFTSKGKPPAFITQLTSSAYSASGSQIAVQSISETTQTPGESKVESDKTKSSTDSETAPTTTIATTPKYTTTIGTVTLPQEAGSKSDLARQDSRIEERREEPQYQNDSAKTGGNSQVPREVTAAVAVPEAKSVAVHPILKSSQSVLDRFRAYNEVRTVKRLVKLFDESSLHEAGIVQTPAIVVTDGKSHATISIDLASVADTPSFSLKGANLKSIRRLSNNKWELDTLPQKGKADVRLSIILKGTSAEIPLVVVPPLIQAGASLVVLSESALDGLLAKSQKNNKPVYDLNSDGKQDYLDDYILLAHWLLKHQKGTSETGQKKKPAAASK